LSGRPTTFCSKMTAGINWYLSSAGTPGSADARFVLTGETTRAVARLVARLDGMPLAIELAAARVEALGVTQLLDRIDDRFALLTAGDRTAPSRLRSLAATVEWSYQLLDEQERRVFRAVSVFPGPFTLEAAEAVAGRDAGPAVLRLVDCSLLVPPRAGPDGRFRYSMLETLRLRQSAARPSRGAGSDCGGPGRVGTRPKLRAPSASGGDCPGHDLIRSSSSPAGESPVGVVARKPGSRPAARAGNGQGRSPASKATLVGATERSAAPSEACRVVRGQDRAEPR